MGQFPGASRWALPMCLYGEPGGLRGKPARKDEGQLHRHHHQASDVCPTAGELLPFGSTGSNAYDTHAHPISCSLHCLSSPSKLAFTNGSLSSSFVLYATTGGCFSVTYQVQGANAYKFYVRINRAPQRL